MEIESEKEKESIYCQKSINRWNWINAMKMNRLGSEVIDVYARLGICECYKQATVKKVC